MASEYYRWKYRDVKPDPPAVLTPAEKRRNWWHYHRWHVAVGAVLLAVAADLLGGVLGLGRREPDYQVAYVGAAPLPAGTAAALEQALAGLGTDCNGDGAVTVRVNQYAGDPSAAGADEARYAEAGNIRLLADLEDCESFFFLMEEYETFQKAYGVLSHPDGSLPDWGDDSGAGCALRWADCPALAGLDLGEYTETVAGVAVTGDSQALLGRLYVGRRGFWTEKTVSHPEACTALWETMTRGAEE